MGVKRSSEMEDSECKRSTKEEIDLFNLPDQLSSSSVQRLVEEADHNDVRPPVSVSSMSRFVAQLQLRIQRNEEMRLKYPDQPEKFLKSEVDLDEEITRVKNISFSNELLCAFLDANGFSLLIPLLGHDNVDLAAAVLSALVDMTSPDIDFDQEERLLETFIQHGLFTFLGELVYRLDETQESDEDIVTSILQTLDHLLDMSPTSISDHLVVQSPKFLSWILKRLRGSTDSKSTAKLISYNRCYCAEILSIVLQHCEKSRSLLGDVSEYNAVEKLLRCLSVYRKVDPQSAEEDEFVANISNCLILLLEQPSNQDIFGNVLGLDLMIRLLRDRKKVYPLALKVITEALRDHPVNCELFVERLGLKSLFGIFMKRGVHCRGESLATKNEDEYCLNSILHLCRYTTKTALARVLNKFIEHGSEKLERLLELHLNYFDTVMRNKKTLKNALEEVDELKQFNLSEEEATYLQRCESGLFILQCVDHILLRLVNMGNAVVVQRLGSLLNIKGINAKEIETVMEEYISHLDKGGQERQNLEALLHVFQEEMIGCKA